MASKKIDELEQRRTAALQMGGVEKVGRQHQRGKLTVRERIDILMDSGTFQEYGLLANRLGWHPGADITPSSLWPSCPESLRK